MNKTGKIQETGKNLQNFDLIFFHINENGFTDCYKILLTDKYKTSNSDNLYHIAFIDIQNGKPLLKEYFDAILLDPMVWISNLFGSNLQGLILKKSDKSNDFFESYIRNPEKILDLIGLEVVHF